MSITDELREWMDRTTIRFDDRGCLLGTAEELTAIADRIDAEHERAVMSAMNDALYHANDESMAELGWVRLPLDTDGVPIRVGDVMEGEKVGGGYGEPFEVIGYVMSNCEFEPMDEHKLPRKSKYLRHHHEPTVEDVLQEMLVQAVGYSDANTTVAYNTIAEYAAKLRLVGDDA